jgi:hypothetical protein
MSDEITETAKAAQEIAKTARKGIEATEKLGKFVSRITNEPLETIMGIINDKLLFTRWNRRLRLMDRADEILKERHVEGSIRVVPPKLALPIIENASLEEDDELQDLWATLLASALDPNFGGNIRSAFIDIIKQLEVFDVHLLKVIYDDYKIWDDSCINSIGGHRYSPTSHPVFQWHINIKLPDLEPRAYENSIDNLIRVRCIDSYVEDKTIITGEHSYSPTYAGVTVHHHYESLCMTALGVDFVEACIGRKVNAEDGAT